MEEELKCPGCHHYLVDPILLQCAHSYCRACALAKQTKLSSVPQPPLAHSPQPSTAAAEETASLSDCCSSSTNTNNDDKASVGSETDSGVICGANRASRPSSFLCPSTSTPTQSNSLPPLPLPPPPRIPSILSPSAYSASYMLLTCEACHKPSYFCDDTSIRQAPTNVALERVLRRFLSTSTKEQVEVEGEAMTPSEGEWHRCQWCEGPSQPSRAVFYCETCGYFYCSTCQPVIHPPRGPLKDHKLVLANNGPTSSTSSTADRPPPATAAMSCPAEVSPNCEALHPSEPLTLYCQVCRMAVCCECLKDARHANHDVQSLSTAVKGQKTELSNTLKQLSEKAKQSTEEVGRLKQLQERINANCLDLKTSLDVEIDSLVELLQERRRSLHEAVDAECERKRLSLKDQIAHCNSHLSRTTSLIQFSIELLKETEPLAYLQIGNALFNRVTNQEFLWHKEMRTRARVEPDFRLDLHTHQLASTIQQLNFAQLKVPPPPRIRPSDCSVENNNVTIAWGCGADGDGQCTAAAPRSERVPIDGYTLEMDSGTASTTPTFKEVYTGPESICKVVGLSFDTPYRARVRAFNGAGQSAYSDVIQLQTAHVAWFHLLPPPLDCGIPPGEIQLSSNGDPHTHPHPDLLTSTSLDYRTVLGSLGIASGTHYWEVNVERFEGNADVVVGVAQEAVNRSLMLGKDLHGWGMYVDSDRSWFLHNGSHHGRQRQEGKVRPGCVIGIKMDCDSGTISFFIDDERVGDCAFRNMPRGCYYPAFSVNRSTNISLHSGISPPPSPAPVTGTKAITLQQQH